MDSELSSALIYIIGYLLATSFLVLAWIKTKQPITLAMMVCFGILMVQSIGYFVFLIRLEPNARVEETELARLPDLLLNELPLFSSVGFILVERIYSAFKKQRAKKSECNGRC